MWLTISPVRDASGRLVGVSEIARGVTERKRWEEALRTSEARFRALVENSWEGVTLLDADGVIRYTSPATTRVLGYALEEYVGRSAAEFVHPEDRAAAAEAMAGVAGSPGSSAILSYRYRHRNGSWLRVETAATNLLDDPHVRALVLNSRDVTEALAAAGALRHSEERHRALAESIPNLVWVYAPDGTPEYFNRRWTEYTGVGAEDLAACTRSEIVHPGDRPRMDELWGRALSDAHLYEIECRLRRADGEYRWHLGRAVPVRDPEGRVVQWFGTFTDIHDGRRAEEALRLRDRAIRAVAQGIVITDATRADTPVIYASPGFEQLTGYTAAEVVGRNCRLLQGPETDPEAVARVRAAVRDGAPCVVEVLNYRRDGTPFWNELSISPVRDEDGRLTHFVGVQADVTARRRLEEQYRQAQKMEAVGQLASGIAHDFNNLLTVINGFSDLLLYSLPPADPSRELLDEVRGAGERASRLTRQLLAFSRRQVLAPRVLDLNTVAGDTETMLRRLIGEDVRLACLQDPELWPVRADPGQVEQVLLNLAVNARDAMPTGGRLTIETRNVELDDEYARAHPGVHAGPHVLLAVSDTGCGMADEVKARVFEPFFTTKGPGRGTGLGLATVYGIVTQSGGHVEVDSELGLGTTFRVYLPRAEGPVGASKPEAGAAALPRGAETVLLVEDDPSVRALNRRILAGCGYTVLEAGDGDEAWRAAVRHAGPIHLLVTDVVMPGQGGRAVAERLLARRPCNETVAGPSLPPVGTAGFEPATP